MKSWKPLPRATGSIELWSQLALVVIEFPVNTGVPRKAYVSLCCLVLRRGNDGQTANGWNSLVWPGEREERLKFTRSEWFINNGDDNEIRVLISQLSIKMVAVYLKLTLKLLLQEFSSTKFRGIYFSVSNDRYLFFNVADQPPYLIWDLDSGSHDFGGLVFQELNIL